MRPGSVGKMQVGGERDAVGERYEQVADYAYLEPLRV
jgi:hypothetical protein